MKKQAKTVQCHCGRVKLTAKIQLPLNNLRRCNCSLCVKRGYIMTSVPLADLQIDQGAEYLSLYQFNKNIAKHYFCSHCGVYTHHQRRSAPSQYAINVGCIEGVNPIALTETDIGLGDGASQS